MWDLLRTVFGEATFDEVALVALFFMCIVIYAHVPRLGETIGSWFDRNKE